MKKNSYFLLLCFMSGSLLNIQATYCKEPVYIYRQIAPAGVKVAMSFMTICGAICLGKGLWDLQQKHKNGHEKTLMVELAKKDEEAKALVILGSLSIGMNLIWLPKIIRNYLKRDKPLITMREDGVMVEDKRVSWLDLFKIMQFTTEDHRGHVLSRKIQLRDLFGQTLAEIDGELLPMSYEQLAERLNTYKNQL